LNLKLAEVIAETLEIDVAEVTPELVRDGHPNWDSFNHLRLMTAIEETFGVQFAMDEIEGIETVGQLDALLEGYLTEA
jgi:acyl carrier protein